jgi:hypothetical protein
MSDGGGDNWQEEEEGQEFRSVVKFRPPPFDGDLTDDNEEERGVRKVIAKDGDEGEERFSEEEEEEGPDDNNDDDEHDEQNAEGTCTPSPLLSTGA